MSVEFVLVHFFIQIREELLHYLRMVIFSFSAYRIKKGGLKCLGFLKGENKKKGQKRVYVLEFSFVSKHLLYVVIFFIIIYICTCQMFEKRKRKEGVHLLRTMSLLRVCFFLYFFCLNFRINNVLSALRWQEIKLLRCSLTISLRYVI